MSDQPISKFMLTAKGAINLGFGAGMVVAPDQMLRISGDAVDPSIVSMTRLFGAALLEIGAIQFLARNAPRSGLKSLLVGAVALFDLMGLGLNVPAIVAGMVSGSGWLDVGLYAFAGFGFALAWLKECRVPATASPVAAR